MSTSANDSASLNFRFVPDDLRSLLLHRSEGFFLCQGPKVGVWTCQSGCTFSTNIKK